MQIEFKITGEDQNELMPYFQAQNRDAFLFELFHNFFRQWKNTDGLVDIEDVKEKLFELKNEHNVSLIDY
jgi:hypothetical protein